jgi:hypothetical protein
VGSGGVWGLGFKVQGSGFKVQGSRFKVLCGSACSKDGALAGLRFQI